MKYIHVAALGALLALAGCKVPDATEVGPPRIGDPNFLDVYVDAERGVACYRGRSGTLSCVVLPR